MSATCQMMPRPWDIDTLCGKPAIGIHEHTVHVCLDCATGLLREEFEIIWDDQTPAQLGDRYQFIYPARDRQFDCELTVVRLSRLDGEPDGEELVFFDDGSHSKQKNLTKVRKLPA